MLSAICWYSRVYNPPLSDSELVTRSWSSSYSGELLTAAGRCKNAQLNFYQNTINNSNSVLVKIICDWCKEHTFQTGNFLDLSYYSTSTRNSLCFSLGWEAIPKVCRIWMKRVQNKVVIGKIRTGGIETFLWRRRPHHHSTPSTLFLLSALTEFSRVANVSFQQLRLTSKYLKETREYKPLHKVEIELA